MQTTSKFENLIVWQRARRLAADVYRFVKDSAIANDFPFRDQIQRAAISVAANIAEGAERGNRNEYAYFLRIAKASAGELRCHLILACDIGLCTAPAALRLQDEITRDRPHARRPHPAPAVTG